ncbi:MAG: hypothetical protein NTZ56_20605 [Acidobacteria bacterium]|nr:hypothetical protein [Acidobacteriota bacterium]
MLPLIALGTTLAAGCLQPDGARVVFDLPAERNALGLVKVLRRDAGGRLISVPETEPFRTREKFVVEMTAPADGAAAVFAREDGDADFQLVRPSFMVKQNERVPFDLAFDDKPGAIQFCVVLVARDLETDFLMPRFKSGQLAFAALRRLSQGSKGVLRQPPPGEIRMSSIGHLFWVSFNLQSHSNPSQ